MFSLCIIELRNGSILSFSDVNVDINKDFVEVQSTKDGEVHIFPTDFVAHIKLLK